MCGNRDHKKITCSFTTTKISKIPKNFKPTLKIHSNNISSSQSNLSKTMSNTDPPKPPKPVQLSLNEHTPQQGLLQMDNQKKEDSLKSAAGKSLKKLSKKQQYEMFGIREKDHKMKDALAYVILISYLLLWNYFFVTFRRRFLKKRLRDAFLERMLKILIWR